MSQTVAVELLLPDDLARFRLPPGVDERLTSLLLTGDPNRRPMQFRNGGVVCLEKDPNGTWSLYVVDDAGSDIGSMSGRVVADYL